MTMKQKPIYYAFGFLSFLVTLVTYTMTMQPSTPFWDCGEFSAAAIWQQVPHPPGSPLFLMAGKLFQFVFPFGDLNWSINFLSVMATAVTVFLLYFIIVKAIMNYRKDGIETIGDALAVYGSALVGALAFCWSDTLWFNGVESEVYASTTVFTTIVVYFMMRWNEVADQPGHERYLLLILYIIVLSSGVHLLAILTIFSVVLVVYFRKYQFSIKSFLVMGIIALVSFFVVYQVIIMWIPNFLAGNLPFKTAAKEPIIEGEPIITILFIIGVLALGYGWWWANKKSKTLPKLIFAAMLLMIAAYTVNLHVIIRANSNTPLNENEPSSFKKLVSYLGREQYGDSPYWPRRFDSRDDSKIQNYQKYGKWYKPEERAAKRRDGTERPNYVYTNVNFAGEMDYLWNYQINHMFIRYFLWNFVGRESDIQDSDVTWFDNTNADFINYKMGFNQDFPVKFFALPLLFGLIGFFFHFKKDRKMAFAYLIMFLLMGVLATIAQNQLEKQPRERDYFYTGAFMVFCLWIGIGVYSLCTELFKKKLPVFAIVAIVAASMVLVPLNMAKGGWKVHSRAGNYLPFDFAYNLLQSCEKDAIIFTAGDNDTFPLWNVQDVLGIRRDVRVVNLSLGGTLWYVNQLKNCSPWGAKKLPLTFADETLRGDELDKNSLSYEVREKPYDVSLKLPKEFFAKFTNDSATLANQTMKFIFSGSGGAQYQFYGVNDRLVLEILKTCMADRPIYFSMTTGQEPQKYGLGKFLRNEGLCYRVCPVETSKLIGGEYNTVAMDKSLLEVDNSNNYATDFQYGFKFRGLGEPGVYFDEKHRENMDIYRNVYLNYARYVLNNQKDSVKCIKLIDQMFKQISPVVFPLWYDEMKYVEEILTKAGDRDKAFSYCKNWINKDFNGDPSAGVMKMRKRYDAIRSKYKIDEKNRFVMRLLYDAILSIASIEKLSIYEVYKAQGLDAALDFGKKLVDKYKAEPDQNIQYISQEIEDMLNEWKPPQIAETQLSPVAEDKPEK